MIGLDSNVLLRAALNDDKDQSPAAYAFLRELSQDSPGVINVVVLSELAWTLRTKGMARRDVLDRLTALLESDAYLVSDREAVGRAIERCRSHKLEFPDALISEINLLTGAPTTITFDKDALRTPAFSPVPSTFPRA